MKTQLVIIQPTSLCNINCRYCYLSHRTAKKRIKMETISQIAQRLFASSFIADEVTIVWHAGEPLLLPIAFYEEAFQAIEQWNTDGVHITHSFQTNATLITQEWCNFFKKHSIQLGVSVDGPQWIHDANRLDWAGKGTFDRVLRGITLLQANQQEFSIIAVVTRNAVQHADELWQFFMDIRPVRLGLNAEEVDGNNRQSSLQALEDIDAYRLFFQRIIELGEQAQEPIPVREVVALTDCMKRGQRFTRSQTNLPMVIISFDCDGNISTFSPELLTMSDTTYGDFHFGNVFADALEDILQKEKFQSVNRQIQRGVLKCLQTCPYFMFCGGGNPSNKISENGSFDSTETSACRLRIKASTNALLDHMEEYYQIEPPDKIAAHLYVESRSE